MAEPSKASARPPLIELRLWRQFLAVAEELHFGRAAAGLHMTQPPLTQAIAQLEGLIGLRLFDRTKRMVRLTPAGAALVPEARELLARAQALPAYARANADGEAGRLRLAFVSTVGFDLLPRWVRAFRKQYPKVQLELMEATGDVQLQAFERGEIDAGLMLHSPGSAPPGLCCQRISQEPLVVALPAQSAVAALEGLAFSDLIDQPLVIFPRRILPSIHDAILDMYHACGHAPAVAQEALQMQTIVNLVSAGLGLAWVPESVRQFQRPGVVYRSLPASVGRSRSRLKQPAVPGCETSLVWLGEARASGNPVLGRFITCINEVTG
jgi:DNA-binding transcriptional LysR family regulator